MSAEEVTRLLEVMAGKDEVTENEPGVYTHTFTAEHPGAAEIDTWLERVFAEAYNPAQGSGTSAQG